MSRLTSLRPQRPLTSYDSSSHAVWTTVSDRNEKLENVYALLLNTLFNDVTGRIHRHIEENRDLLARLKTHEESKKFLRRNFTTSRIVQRVLDEVDVIFIESGSTLFYVALGLVESLRGCRHKFADRPLTVCTNNVLVYMLLLFEQHIHAILLPGKPTNS